jgi:hypothetical protein
MNSSCSSLFFTIRGAWGRPLAALMGLALLALAACSGTAVVTMTSTASTDNFLAYRVGLVSVQLQGSGGNSGLTVLPASTTVDFTTLTDVSEVLGASPVTKGTYTSALVTLDYSSAQIVYDNGTLNGVNLTPVGANGKALGQVKITVTLDPSESFSVSSKGASQLAMNFNMAASNVVDLTNNTVTVTPMIVASALPIDSKQVRIRGPLVSATSSASFTMDVMPFNSTTSGKGALVIVPTTNTTFEINGTSSIGGTGLAQLATLGTGNLAVAYGTLTAANQTTTTTMLGTTPTTATTTLSTTGTTAYPTTDTTTTSTVSFSATQILAGSSVQGSGLDRVSGTVSARSGNAVAVEDATWVAADGTETFIGGTTSIIMGPNTLITVFGQDGSEINSLQQVSVGASIDAFGVLTAESSDNATLDVSAGHVRLDNTTASGLVTVQGSGLLTLNLSYLGGRVVTDAALAIVDSGVSPTSYVVNTGSGDLANSTVGAPVIVTGQTPSFETAPLSFTAVTLLDPTTIQAELVVDWGTGTASPFVTYNSTAIDLDVHNTSISSIGVRHAIQVGAQVIPIVGLTSDPLISPNATSSASVFAIGHPPTSTIESFNTYAAFIAQLQTELTGTTLATGMTATGQYTSSSSSFAATSITVFLSK